jgi:hypothetical protein
MRKMGVAVAAACLVGLAMPMTAQAAQAPAARSQAGIRGVSDPRAFVEMVYARYRAAPDTPPADPINSYSDRLRALFNAYNNWQAEHDDLVGALSFDWWTNSQDWGDIRATLREERRGPNRRIIVARIVDFGTESVNRFHFVRVGNRWFLDEVVNGTGRGGEGWTLSALLRERPE